MLMIDMSGLHVTKERKTVLKKITALESSHKPPKACSNGVPHYPLGNKSADKHWVLIYHDEMTSTAVRGEKLVGI